MSRTAHSGVVKSTPLSFFSFANPVNAQTTSPFSKHVVPIPWTATDSCQWSPAADRTTAVVIRHQYRLPCGLRRTAVTRRPPGTLGGSKRPPAGAAPPE